MKIARIDSFIHSIPFKRPFGIAGGTVASAEHVIVKVSCDDGTHGVGEAAPMPTYFPETAERAASVLSEHLTPAVVGLSPFDLERVNEEMDRAFPGHSFAKGAIDVALHDIVGKKLDTPVYNLLGGLCRREVPLAWAVGTGTREEMVAEAKRYARSGFETIKVKIGTDPDTDVGNVAAIRKAIGDDKKLRVDANQGYDLQTACIVLREMRRYDLEIVEQPLPRDDLQGMAELRRRFSIPIMADESLVTPRDAMKLIENGAADIFNIKVMRVGGLHNAKKIAHVAQAAGIPCLAGSMVEFGIGTAAGLHFALSTPNVDFAAELIGPEMLSGDVIEKADFLGACGGGSLSAPAAPGLGVELLEEHMACLH